MKIKTIILKFFVQASFYPRIALDWIIFQFIKNDYSILEKFKHQECLIVGNGPSLNTTELDLINMLSIGMNKINLLFPRTSWRPDLIVCVNGLVIRQNKDFFNSTRIPIILPVKAFYLGIKKRPNVIFIKISDSMKFEANFQKSFGFGSTVTFTCLQVAAALNVKSINIVGVDHSFKIENSKVKKEHDIEVLKEDDVNHFDPNYFKGKMWGLPDLDGSEKAYLLARKKLEAKYIPIVDYTINGKLQVFTKGNVEKIYSKK